jgi:hypothetical protein
LRYAKSRTPLRQQADVHRVLVKKKPEISDADFIKHYNEKHAQAAATVLLKHKIISYSLVCSIAIDLAIRL